MSAPLSHFNFSSNYFLRYGGGFLWIFFEACQPPPTSIWIPQEDYTIQYPSDWQIKLEEQKLLVYPQEHGSGVLAISVFPQTKSIDSLKAQAIISSIYSLLRPQVQIRPTSGASQIFFDYAHRDTLRNLRCYTQLRQFNDKLALITAHSPMSSPKSLQKRLIRIAQSFRFVVRDSSSTPESL